MLQRPRPTRFARVASVLPTASLSVQRTRTAVEGTPGHRCGGADSSGASRRESGLLFNAAGCSPADKVAAHPAAPDQRSKGTRRTPRKVEQHRVATSRADGRTKRGCPSSSTKAPWAAATPRPSRSSTSTTRMVMDVSPEKSTSRAFCATASDQCVNQILAARPESWPHAIDATPARRRID